MSFKGKRKPAPLQPSNDALTIADMLVDLNTISKMVLTPFIFIFPLPLARCA